MTPGTPPSQPNPWSGMGAAWGVTTMLLAGLLVWGGLGYLVDRLAGTRPLFLAIGLLVGVAGGIYLVYLRYGKPSDDDR